MTGAMTVVPAAAPTRLDTAEADAVRVAVMSVLDDGPWVLGDPVERFEQELAAYVGLPHAVGVGNGTDALVLAFAALELPRGSLVLVAANEGGYAATAARQAGLVPRVMDVDPNTMGPGAAEAEAAWVPGVSAVVLTHLHGDAVPSATLDVWRRRRGLALVEDCAQAHGLVVDGAHVGSRGDAATFSFYPTKNLGAVGDGGAVCFRAPRPAARARALRQYGWGDRFRVELAGGRNSRLDTLQAAMLLARLPHLERRNARRRAIADSYRIATKGSALHVHGDPSTSVAHHVVVVADERDRLREHLERCRVATAVHYPYLLGEMPGLELAPAPAPVAGRLRDRILSLPCFPEMTDQEVEVVCDALATWGESRG